jgi:hypothetical protein
MRCNLSWANSVSAGAIFRAVVQGGVLLKSDVFDDCDEKLGWEEGWDDEVDCEDAGEASSTWEEGWDDEVDCEDAGEASSTWEEGGVVSHEFSERGCMFWSSWGAGVWGGEVVSIVEVDPEVVPVNGSFAVNSLPFVLAVGASTARPVLVTDSCPGLPWEPSSAHQEKGCS